MNNKLTLMRASDEAERLWVTEIVAVFGEREAPMARFQQRANGEPGSHLRELHDAYIAAHEAYSVASRSTAPAENPKRRV